MAYAHGRHSRIWLNENVADMWVAIDKYFAEHPDKTNPPTLAGLALALGAKDIRAVEQWCRNTSPGVDKVAEAASYAVLKLCEQCETWGIQHNGNPAFIIFLMKNLGYSDKQELSLGENLDSFLMELNQAIKRKEGE